jgi:hypothetical protein
MGRTAIYGGAPLPFSFPLLFARSSDIWRDLSVTTSQRAKLRFGMTWYGITAASLPVRLVFR